MKRRRAAPLGDTNNRGSAGVRSRREVSISATNRPVPFGTSALIMLLAALGRLLWRGLRFAPPECRRGYLMYTSATGLPKLYIRNIMLDEMSIPLLGHLTLSGWGEADFAITEF